MNEVNILFTSLKHIQEIQTGKVFNLYSKIYKGVAKKLFRKSSVSISFRLRLKDDIIKKISKQSKEKLKEDLIFFLNDIKNYKKEKFQDEKLLDLDKTELFLKNRLNVTDIDELINADILFIKRATNIRDKFSGNIAFPGGKYEKEDKNDFVTAIRETEEEISLKFCKDSPIISRYISPNLNFDITMDFRYFVNSHLFIIFDLFNECENYITLNKDEISDVLFVNIKFFLGITDLNKSKMIKYIKHNTFGHEVDIAKLILNENENFLVYGLTLRKLIGFLNSKNRNVSYEEDFNFNHKIKNMIFNMSILSLKFFTNPYKSYILFKNTIIFIIGIILARSFWQNCMRSRF